MRIILDTNILVHAHNRSSPKQEKASDILGRVLRKELEAVITPQILHEFYSVITSSNHVERPLRPREASEICADLLESPDMEKVMPSLMTSRTAFQLAGDLGLKGSQIFDCLLAVTANENGIEKIYTENTKDFEKYDFLIVENPLG
jgi:hypothetical protein